MTGFLSYVWISSDITTEVVNCFGAWLKFVEGAGVVMTSLPPPHKRTIFAFTHLLLQDVFGKIP